MQKQRSSLLPVDLTDPCSVRSTHCLFIFLPYTMMYLQVCIARNDPSKTKLRLRYIQRLLQLNELPKHHLYYNLKYSYLDENMCCKSIVLL